MNHSEIIDKIFKLRKKLGISQENMAGMIGVQKDTLSRWESKKHVPLKMARRKMEEILRFKPGRQGENNGKEKNKNKE